MLNNSTITKGLAIFGGELCAISMLINDIMTHAYDLGYIAVKTVLVASIGAVVPLLVRRLWNKKFDNEKN